MRKVTIALMAFFLASCSVIKVSTNDEVKTYRKFGFVNFVQSSNGGTYVESTVLGFGFSHHDLVMGYKHSKEIVMTEDKCTVFIENDSEIHSRVIDYLQSINCNFIYLHGENKNE